MSSGLLLLLIKKLLHLNTIIRCLFSGSNRIAVENTEKQWNNLFTATEIHMEQLRAERTMNMCKCKSQPLYSPKQVSISQN